LNSILSGWHTDIPVPIDGQNGYVGKTVTADIPASVSTADFPQDKWQFKLDGALNVPPGIIATAGEASNGPAYDFLVPLHMQFGQDPGVGQWHMARTDKFGDVDPADEHLVTEADAKAVLGRTSDVLLFVYVVAFTPLLLGAVYLTNFRRGKDDMVAALSLAAVLLSLLTLRQVVTPSDIQGITRLDRLLGLELLVVIAAFSVTALWGRSQHTKSPEADHIRNAQTEASPSQRHANCPNSHGN
jgi:hypothetical protein